MIDSSPATPLNRRRASVSCCRVAGARKNESASLVLQRHGLHGSAIVQRNIPGQVCVDAYQVFLETPKLQTAKLNPTYSTIIVRSQTGGIQY